MDSLTNCARLPRMSLLALLFAFILTSCSSGPEPINYGSDNCEYCRMGIVDARFGCELVTVQGKNYKFDSIECLAAFSLKGNVPEDEIASLWVTAYPSPARLIAVSASTYLRSDALRSPMGMNFSAFASRSEAEVAIKEYRGQILSWQELVELIETEDF